MEHLYRSILAHAGFAHLYWDESLLAWDCVNPSPSNLLSLALVRIHWEHMPPTVLLQILDRIFEKVGVDSLRENYLLNNHSVLVPVFCNPALPAPIRSTLFEIFSTETAFQMKYLESAAVLEHLLLKPNQENNISMYKSIASRCRETSVILKTWFHLRQKTPKNKQADSKFWNSSLLSLASIFETWEWFINDMETNDDAWVLGCLALPNFEAFRLKRPLCPQNTSNFIKKYTAALLTGHWEFLGDVAPEHHEVQSLVTLCATLRPKNPFKYDEKKPFVDNPVHIIEQLCKPIVKSSFLELKDLNELLVRTVPLDSLLNIRWGFNYKKSQLYERIVPILKANSQENLMTMLFIANCEIFVRDNAFRIARNHSLPNTVVSMVISTLKERGFDSFAFQMVSEKFNSKNFYKSFEKTIGQALLDTHPWGYLHPKIAQECLQAGLPLLENNHFVSHLAYPVKMYHLQDFMPDEKSVRQFIKGRSRITEDALLAEFTTKRSILPKPCANISLEKYNNYTWYKSHIESFCDETLYKDLYEVPFSSWLNDCYLCVPYCHLIDHSFHCPKQLRIVPSNVVSVIKRNVLYGLIDLEKHVLSELKKQWVNTAVLTKTTCLNNIFPNILPEDIVKYIRTFVPVRPKLPISPEVAFFYFVSKNRNEQFLFFKYCKKRKLCIYKKK